MKIMILKPLEIIGITAQKIGQGDLSVNASVGSTDEIGNLALRMNEMIQGFLGVILLYTIKELLHASIPRFRDSSKLMEVCQHCIGMCIPRCNSKNRMCLRSQTSIPSEIPRSAGGLYPSPEACQPPTSSSSTMQGWMGG